MKDVVGMGLGAKIRGLREEIGMSQAHLASQAELSQGYLSQIENDEVRNPSASVLFRLAQSLNVDPRSLLEAAGYEEGVNGGGEVQYETPVDPDLLRFLARIPSEQQRDLLSLLRGIEREASVKVT
ncbi:MAG: helix-turn-helix transcriptional regulator [Dehalococcoidia bacterium]